MNTSEPTFLDDGPSVDLPSLISTTNAIELYGLQEDETVSKEIARHQLGKSLHNEK